MQEKDSKNERLHFRREVYDKEICRGSENKEHDRKERISMESERNAQGRTKVSQNYKTSLRWLTKK